MKLICRNWRCNLGEIDAVYFDEGELVFVEVKTRVRTNDPGVDVFDNVDYRKQQKLRNLVNIYLLSHYRLLKPPPVRIDLVGVVLDPGSLRVASIEHLVAAI